MKIGVLDEEDDNSLAIVEIYNLGETIRILNIKMKEYQRSKRILNCHFSPTCHYS